ncbi:MAG: DMT family transporter [Rhodospirillales bacterium]|nr:DMT family transporter [Rhodospirillales bacterium]MBO6785360.1 DMT family transporter [Rhodospirillales bacterium]
MGEETAIPDGPKGLTARKAALKGIAWMALAGLLISLMHILVRDVSKTVHPIEIAFFRNVVGFIMLVPFLLRQDRSQWKSKQPKLQLIRSIIGACALMSWFTCLSMLPVADATAISFVTVLFITIGASLVLGEKVGIRRWTAIIVGFIGTLIIVRPGSGIFGPGVFVALASTVFWASALLCVKVLARTDSSVTMVFYANVYFTLFSFIPALIFWSWPTIEELGWLIVIGVMATLGHLCMATALRTTDATIVAPVDYTRLLWAAGVGYLVFGEFPDIWTWVGGTVIFLSTVYITYRESRRKPPGDLTREPRTPTTTVES